MKLICIPFRQDSDVMITSAPNCRQQSAIFSSSVATTIIRESYQFDFRSKPDVHVSIYPIVKLSILFLYMMHWWHAYGLWNALKSDFTTIPTESWSFSINSNTVRKERNSKLLDLGKIQNSLPSKAQQKVLHAWTSAKTGWAEMQCKSFTHPVPGCVCA